MYKLTGVSTVYRAVARTAEAVSGVAARFFHSQAITTSRMTQATNVTTITIRRRGLGQVLVTGIGARS